MGPMMPDTESAYGRQRRPTWCAGRGQRDRGAAAATLRVGGHSPLVSVCCGWCVKCPHRTAELAVLAAPGPGQIAELFELPGCGLHCRSPFPHQVSELLRADLTTELVGICFGPDGQQGHHPFGPQRHAYVPGGGYHQPLGLAAQKLVKPALLILFSHGRPRYQSPIIRERLTRYRISGDWYSACGEGVTTCEEKEKCPMTTTARAIADALEAHFLEPPKPGRAPSGVVLREVTAPDSNRRIDLLAMCLWPSRGYGVDAVEIKVDRRDYLAEIADPAKADPWWQHSNRFWIAAPTTLVADPQQLPPGWGLLVPGNGRRFKIVVKAQERPLQMSTHLCAAILSRQVNSSYDRYRRDLQEALGRQRLQYEEKIRALKHDLASTADPEIRKALNLIRLVEQHAGMRLADFSWRQQLTAPELGQAIRLIVQERRALSDTEQVVTEVIDHMRHRAARLSAAADELATLAQAGQPSNA